MHLQSNKGVNSTRARKDMRMAIKQLVQLQDDFDDLYTMGDAMSWKKHAQTLSNQVTEQVDVIRKSKCKERMRGGLRVWVYTKC